MKDTKKISALILSLIMAFSMALTACSDEDSSSKKNKSKESSSYSSSAVDDSSDKETDSKVTEADDSSESGDTATTTTTAETTTTTTAESDEPDTKTETAPPDSSQPDDTTTTTTAEKKPVGKDPKAETPEEQPVYDFFSALQMCDMKKLEGSLAPELVEYFKENGMWENAEKNIKEGYAKQYGEDFTISLSIDNKYRLKDEDIKEFKEKFKKDYGKDIDIKEAYDINITATISGSKDSNTAPADTKVGLIGGKWYMLEA